jgi:hypothetical protein
LDGPDPTWGQRLWNGLLGAAIGFVGVLLLAVAWHLFSYRRSGRAHENWETIAVFADGLARFTLRQKPGATEMYLAPDDDLEVVVLRIFAAPVVARGTSTLDGGAGRVVNEVLRVLAVKPVRTRAGTLHKNARGSHVVTVARTEDESNG